MSWTMMSPECQRCQTPRVGAARPSSKHHTRQVGPVVIQLIHKTTPTVMTIDDDNIFDLIFVFVESYWQHAID